jgi:hypothetical protein
MDVDAEPDVAPVGPQFHFNPNCEMLLELNTMGVGIQETLLYPYIQPRCLCTQPLAPSTC